jgi:hypothetical protein
VLTSALYTRFRSRQDHTFAEKLLSAMRYEFGGHVEPKKALLDSQFATLEEPGADENPLVVQVEASKEAIVEQVVSELRLG